MMFSDSLEAKIEEFLEWGLEEWSGDALTFSERLYDLIIAAHAEGRQHE